MPPDPNLDSDATIRGLHAGQRVFERYTLVRIVGRGGMGIVWLARDDKLAREVALKFLPEFFVHDQFAVDQLKRETSRCLGLTHEGIVRIYDFLEDPEQSLAAISMEYVAGANLSNLRLQRPHRCFSVEELGPIVRQVCEALHYAHHRAHVVHRDIKPANLLLDSRGEVKITDFGIARSLAESASRISADFNMSAGTLSYMSPQQALGERPSEADDIYALGATIYDLLTGRPPFHSGNIYLQLKEIAPPTLTARRAEFGLPDPSVPRAWEETIHACLEKPPEHRPKSAMEVAERLGLVRTESSASTTAPPPPPPTPPRRASRFSVRHFVYAAIIALWLAISWFGLNRREQVPSPKANTELESQVQQERETTESLRKQLEAAQAAAAAARSAELPPVPASAPGVLLVPAQYKTIQEAIDAAEGDATVVVTPGTYTEALRFKSGIKLIGTDPKTCKLRVPPGPGAAILAIDCAKGSIERLDISPVVENPQTYWPEFNLDPESRVTSVQAESDAAHGGLKTGALIHRVDGIQLARGSSDYFLARPHFSIEIEEPAGQTRVLTLTSRLEQVKGLPSGIALIRSPLEIS